MIGVVGGGIVGLAAADALVQAGHEVRLYERARPGAGQSGGHTRIFRHAHDDPRLVALAVESRGGWRAWEERFGTALLRGHGVLAAGPRVLERQALLAGAGVRARLLEPAEQREHFGVLGEPFAGPVLLDEEAGAIDVQAALGALAGALAARVVPAEVFALRAARAQTVEVVTSEGVFEHAAVLVCAGQETARLAAAVGVEIEAGLSCHLRATFAVRDPPPRLACLQDSSGQHGETVYAAPFPGNARCAVGVTGADVAVGADGTVASVEALTALRGRAAHYVATALPGLNPTPVGERTCWATELPWSSDAIGAWHHAGVTFAVGQNLFKHAPAVGARLAQGVLDGGPSELLAPAARLGDSTLCTERAAPLGTVIRREPPHEDRRHHRPRVA